jgi:Tfp pilus assembly protein PilN
MILTDQIAELNDEIAVIQASAEYQEALALQSEMETLTEYEKGADLVLADFERQNTLGTSVLDQLTASLPANVNISSMNLNHAAFTATFNVPDRRTGAELILRLEESGLFQYVHTSSLTQTDEQPGYSMYVECERKVGEIE